MPRMRPSTSLSIVYAWYEYICFCILEADSSCVPMAYRLAEGEMIKVFAIPHVVVLIVRMMRDPLTHPPARTILFFQHLYTYGAYDTHETPVLLSCT